jgi:hypothetical protein
MNSLAQTPSVTIAHPRRNRLVGWSAVASGLALIIVGEKPYFPRHGIWGCSSQPSPSTSA